MKGGSWAGGAAEDGCEGEASGRTVGVQGVDGRVDERDDGDAVLHGKGGAWARHGRVSDGGQAAIRRVEAQWLPSGVCGEFKSSEKV